jgi:hypothetical protein
VAPRDYDSLSDDELLARYDALGEEERKEILDVILARRSLRMKKGGSAERRRFRDLLMKITQKKD